MAKKEVIVEATKKRPRKSTASEHVDAPEIPQSKPDHAEVKKAVSEPSPQAAQAAVPVQKEMQTQPQQAQSPAPAQVAAPMAAPTANSTRY